MKFLQIVFWFAVLRGLMLKLPTVQPQAMVRRLYTALLKVPPQALCLRGWGGTNLPKKPHTQEMVEAAYAQRVPTVMASS